MNLVIIPTYNELENVEAIIRAVFALSEPFHVLIVDDGSPDGTGDVVRKLQDGPFSGRLHLLERRGKLGLGTAYIAGFRWGLARSYAYFFEMDADKQIGSNRYCMFTFCFLVDKIETLHILQGN